ncbi:MAG: DNA polymerase III subunit beta [Endomicrobium sp.]|jgi:DNA polymerase-3 subunit beta|nr:DNA polymerase III subunit beta [Endomicrobium sp.]
MKIVCNKDELIKGMQIISSAISLKSTLPVLLNFLLETNKEKLKISATDLEIAIQCYINGDIIDNGSITIPAKKFTDIVKELQHDNIIEILTEETNKIIIKSKTSVFNIIGISKDEYPIIPQFPIENNFNIKKELFIQMLKKTIFAASKDSQRYILNGICFDINNNVFKMIATDGKRLSYIVTNKIYSNLNCKLVVPVKSAQDILRLLIYDISCCEEIKIGVTKNQISIKINDIIFVSTLIDGVFPNYDQVIPKTHKTSVVLDVKETITAVKQMSTIAIDKLALDRTSSIKFSFDKNILKISASTVGVGFGDVTINSDYCGEPISFNFNPVFIKDALQNIDTNFTVFEFNDSIDPVVITEKHKDGIYNKDFFCVIMPMRA